MAVQQSGKQDDTFFGILFLEITKDFPTLTIDELEEAILNGIKGQYNTESFVMVNSITIYRWIQRLLNDRIPNYKNQLKNYGI